MRYKRGIISKQNGGGGGGGGGGLLLDRQEGGDQGDIGEDINRDGFGRDREDIFICSSSPYLSHDSNLSTCNE